MDEAIVFLESYIGRLETVATDSHLEALYRWVWHQDRDHGAVGVTVAFLNAALGLDDEYALKPDLPCISVGSRAGLVILAANPGWSEVANAQEDGYSKQSANAYVQLMMDYFGSYHRVVQQPNPWWNRTYKFMRLLANCADRVGAVPSRETARSSALMGGWELLPFHSRKDGITSHLLRQRKRPPRDQNRATAEGLLRRLMETSAACLLRFEPEVVFVASAMGARWMRQFAGISQSTVLGRKQTKIHYKRRGPTEIIALELQLFANSYQSFSDDDVFVAVEELRRRSQASS